MVTKLLVAKPITKMVAKSLSERPITGLKPVKEIKEVKKAIDDLKTSFWISRREYRDR